MTAVLYVTCILLIPMLAGVYWFRALVGYQRALRNRGIKLGIDEEDFYRLGPLGARARMSAQQAAVDPRAKAGELGPAIRKLVRDRDIRWRLMAASAASIVAAGVVLPSLLPWGAETIRTSQDRFAAIIFLAVIWGIALMLQIANVYERRAGRADVVRGWLLAVVSATCGILTALMSWTS